MSRGSIEVLNMSPFFSGMATMGFLVCAAFFFKFWSKTRDRLFSFFAYSFSIMTVERIVFQFISKESESRPYVYILRLCAFLLIAYAIFDKNRSRSDSKKSN